MKRYFGVFFYVLLQLGISITLGILNGGILGYFLVGLSTVELIMLCIGIGILTERTTHVDERGTDNESSGTVENHN